MIWIFMAYFVRPADRIFITGMYYSILHLGIPNFSWVVAATVCYIVSHDHRYW